MKIRIDKIFLHVANIDRATQFYSDTIKLPKIDALDGDVAFDLNGAQLILIPDRERGTARVGADICLWVDDLDRKYGELVLAGVNFFKPPARESWGGKLAGFYDSEGNRIYLIQY